MVIVCSQCQHRNPPDSKFCKECGLRLTRTADPLLGQQIGNHRLVKRIGVGGMGVVYLAEHINLGKKYAVKFLHPQFASDEEVVERFRREAQVIAALDHENIIRENDFGWLDGVGFYLIMEYLEGETLKELIRREGSLAIDRVIAIFDQLMDALDEAHSQSVIHRDLKPENIFLVQRRGRETLKILDFGIARVVMDGAHKDFTVDGEVYGSPTYMSPEQARGEISKVDHRADLYAAGIILVEALTGRPPYQGTTPAEVMLAHISGLPPRLSDLNTEVRFAAGLEDVVLKALAKEADERFQSAQEFWSALLPMLKKTLELQKDIDETIDTPPTKAPTPKASSARVLVSREWTPTPTPSGSSPFQNLDLLPGPPSQPSLPGAPLPISAERDESQPLPTSEMKGLYENHAAEQGEKPEVWSATPLPSHVTQEQPVPPPSAYQQPLPPSHTPAPSLSTPRIEGGTEENLPHSLTPSTPSTPSAFGTAQAIINPLLPTLGEDEDGDPTTISFVAGVSLPSTPPRSIPPQVPSVSLFPSSPPPTVSFHPDAPGMDMLEERDKTERRVQSNPPPAETSFSSPSQPPSELPTYVDDEEDTIPPVIASKRHPEFASMLQTQNQILPQSLPPEFSTPYQTSSTLDAMPETPAPAWMLLIKHPAFLGGVVGFFLLLGIWMLLPGKPQPPTVDSLPDAGSRVEPVRPRIPRPPPRYVRRPNMQQYQPPRNPQVPNDPRDNSNNHSQFPQELVRLTITTTPPGASVFIVGRGKVGTTPYTIQVTVGSRVTIDIRKVGYQSQSIRWVAREHSSTSLRLIPDD